MAMRERAAAHTSGESNDRGSEGESLEADAEAFVNTVNTVGHMGKGMPRAGGPDEQ
jgi:hypothetical protein